MRRRDYSKLDEFCEKLTREKIKEVLFARFEWCGPWQRKSNAIMAAVEGKEKHEAFYSFLLATDVKRHTSGDELSLYAVLDWLQGEGIPCGIRLKCVDACKACEEDPIYLTIEGIKRHLRRKVYGK